VILDIDHFKRINDSHGHAVGDVVLRHFAQVAQSILRDGDVLARWGGEEFLLVLPTDSAASAEALAQRLRERTAATSIALPHGGAVTITVSIGVAALCEGELTSAVLERADAALYRAKAEGRNRVAVA
jgi:diguanylate cyclase (GGDEF)-like protein